MIVAGGLSGLAIGNYMSGFEDEERLQAHFILTETWEALRAIRNNNWANVTNGTHGLAYSNGYWEFSGTSDVWSGITRQVVISDVQRDGDGNIVTSGGTVDSDSKAVQISLTWTPYYDGDSQTVTVNTYLHNYSSPAVWPNP